MQLEGVGVVVSMLVLLGGLGHDGRRDGADDEQRGGLGLARDGRRGEVDEERRGGLGHDRGRRGADDLEERGHVEPDERGLGLQVGVERERV